MQQKIFIYCLYDIGECDKKQEAFVKKVFTLQRIIVRKTENIRLLQQAIACFDDTQAYKQLFLLFYPSLVPFAVSIIKSKELKCSAQHA